MQSAASHSRGLSLARLLDFHQRGERDDLKEVSTGGIELLLRNSEQLQQCLLHGVRILFDYLRYQVDGVLRLLVQTAVKRRGWALILFGSGEDVLKFVEASLQSLDPIDLVLRQLQVVN